MRELLSLEKNRRRAIFIRTIMDMLGEGECLVSDLGLREGVPINLARRGG